MILKNKYSTAILACILALMPIYASFSFASSADELRNKLTEIEQQKRDAEVRRADAERERRAIGSELAEIGEQLKSLDNEARALRGKMNKLQVKIDDNKAKLAKKQAEIAARHKIYKKRLRDIYINGQVNYLDVLLGAKDFSDFSFGGYVFSRRSEKDFAKSAKVHNLLLFAALDCDKIVGAVTVRPRQEGDSFRPAGRGCAKTLRKFFNETGVPAWLRGEIPVICDEKGIIAVGTLAVDERVRVTEKTGNLLIIEGGKNGGHEQ